MATEKNKTKKINKKVKKANTKKTVSTGRIYLYSSYNNTILTFTDTNGNVLAWSSAGLAGFKNAKKSTPYAGQKAADLLNKKIAKFNVKEVEVYVKGKGAAIPLTLKELSSGGYRITALIDNNPIRFGGTRPRKKPRK